MQEIEVTGRPVGSGVPLYEWVAHRYGEYGEYPGHTFVTADPKRLARRLLGVTILTPTDEPVPEDWGQG